jgi:hypothetical protein
MIKPLIKVIRGKSNTSVTVVVGCLALFFVGLFRCLQRDILFARVSKGK